MDKKRKAATAGQRCCGEERTKDAGKQSVSYPQCKCKTKCKHCQCYGKGLDTSGGH